MTEQKHFPNRERKQMFMKNQKSICNPKNFQTFYSKNHKSLQNDIPPLIENTIREPQTWVIKLMTH